MFSIGALAERIALDGKSRTTLAEELPWPAGPLGADATDLYLPVRNADAGNALELRRIPKNGDAATVVGSFSAPPSDRVIALAVEPGPGGEIFGAVTDGKVFRWTKSGGSELDPTLAGTTAFFADAAATYGGTPEKTWVRRHGQPLRTLAREACRAMTGDESHLYCARPKGRQLEIVRLEKASGHAQPVCAFTLDASSGAEPRAPEIDGFAVDARNVYVSAAYVSRADLSGLPMLFGCAKGGGPASLIVKPPFMQALPVVAQHGDLFWVELDSTTVTRIMRAHEPAADAGDLLGCPRDDSTKRPFVKSTLKSDLDPTAAVSFLAAQNMLCPDTYCEGGNEYFFHDVRCSTATSACEIALRLYGKAAHGALDGVEVRAGNVRARIVSHADTKSCTPACMTKGELSPCSVVDAVCTLDATPPFDLANPTSTIGRDLGACTHALDVELRKHEH